MDIQRLKNYLLETLDLEDNLVFESGKMVDAVVRGISLCERARIDWKKAALSYRHIVKGERMAVILSYPNESSPSMISSEHFHELLEKRGTSIRGESLQDYALQMDHPAPHHLSREAEGNFKLQRYLWIKAALFVEELASGRRLDTVAKICREPSRY